MPWDKDQKEENELYILEVKEGHRIDKMRKKILLELKGQTSCSWDCAIQNTNFWELL